MAKFKYRMENILQIKQKLESQEKIAYAQANAKVMEEQDKLSKLMIRRSGYEKHLKELSKGTLDLREISTTKKSIDTMKQLIRAQMMELHIAQKNLELARTRLSDVMKDRKTHENLKEKAFDSFKGELNSQENKVTDELVSYSYHNKG